MQIRTISLFLVLAFALLLGGCFSINSDIEVGDGETVNGGLKTVNGSITVGADSIVNGDAGTVNGSIIIGSSSIVGQLETVNGKVTLGSGARAESIGAVNGSVEVGTEAEVAGQVDTVNGRVLVMSGAVVGEQVGSVNGQIRLEGATVGSLRNVRGGMVLEAGSRVLGELRVAKGRGTGDDDPVLVEIHADSEVLGPLVFERPVRLRIHESATVGEIRGAEPEYFDN